MLKVLLKKQLSEVFKGYFYDAKKNRMRSKWAIAAWFIFFFVIMVGFLGGTFAALSLSMCDGLVSARMGWMYFLLMGGISILLGAFGSIFNAYSGLYLPKDNDLLLSLPIPVRSIIAARLMNVYLMGTMYSATVMLPALIVYWIVAGAAAAQVICGILMFLIITAIVLILSCLLGWVVARISVKLKNKSFITVLVSVLFICAYYFVYFKANDLIRAMIQNADVYGARIKGAAYGLYLFGRIGEGDLPAAAVFAAVTAALAALVWIILERSFLQITTAGGSTGKVRYAEKPAREKTVFRALLDKEFARFTSSPNYMLNCGLGILLIPASGVFLLLRGGMFCGTIDSVFSGRPDAAAVLIVTMLCALSAMNDMTSPSVSLEGKSIWILQSLPVPPQSVLRAKTSMQLILTGIPMLFASVCAASAVPSSLSVKMLMILTPLLYTAFSALFNAAVGTRMPLLNWTSELAPIKQSGAVMIALFGGWIVSVAVFGIYLAVGYRIGAALYLLVWSAVFAAASLILLRWLDRKGAAAFAAL